MYMSLCTAEHVAACAKVPACYQPSPAGAPPMGMMPGGSHHGQPPVKAVVSDWRRQWSYQLGSHMHTDTPNHTHEAVYARLLSISSLGVGGRGAQRMRSHFKGFQL